MAYESPKVLFCFFFLDINILGLESSFFKPPSKDFKYREAMDEELNTLVANEAWALVPS